MITTTIITQPYKGYVGLCTYSYEEKKYIGLIKKINSNIFLFGIFKSEHVEEIQTDFECSVETYSVDGCFPY